MARPKSPRGRGAKQLPPVRVSDDEMRWMKGEAKRTGKSMVKLQRDRIFAPMPGY
jgi:hypothetical protein